MIKHLIARFKALIPSRVFGDRPDDDGFTPSEPDWSMLGGSDDEGADPQPDNGEETTENTEGEPEDDTQADDPAAVSSADDAGEPASGEDEHHDEDEQGEGDETPLPDSGEEQTAEPPKKPEPTEDDEDDDLKEIQPDRNARPQIKSGFKALKAKVKEERAEKAALRERLALLEKQIAEAPKADPQILERLKLAEQKAALVDLDFDPVYTDQIKKPFEEKTDALLDYIDTLLPGVLTDQHKDGVKGKGVHNIKPEWWDGLIAKAPKHLQPAIEKKLSDAIASGMELEAFKKKAQHNPAKYHEELQQREKAYWDQWGAQAREYAEKELLPTLGDWVQPKEVPAGATAEQKAAIEAHNAKIQGYTSQIGERITKVNSRDPREVMNAVISTFHVEHLKGQLADIEKDRDALKAELEETRKQLGAVKKAGAVTQTQKAVAPKRNSVNDLPESIDDSFARWEQEYDNKRK